MTSIEWLEGQFKIYLPSIHQKGLENAFEKAKEMHKKEIEYAYRIGACEVDKMIVNKPEQYYNETFK